jgi:HD-GYP domain-containing protein (c-di-GMP phosphodiesterase class II)
MITTRPYRKALSHREALEEMQRCSGTQFDPDVVEALCAEVGAPRSGVDARTAAA